MEPIAALSTALTAFRTSVDLAKSAVSARDDALITKAIRDMSDRLFDVQQGSTLVQEKNQALIERNAALQDENLQLHRTVAELKQRLDDTERYEKHTTARGGVVLRHKEASETSKPPIYVCINCFGAGKKTFLQPDSNGWWLACQEHGNIPSDSLSQAWDPSDYLEKPRGF
ncbi:hypothetical protein [Pandoraea apista]|uniref:hypothetical protein n=1 Tax=Pandoraea apista TaxID=93218 RepID=UPI000F688347|nr:hypothetical protein [Pandoraea apista]RRW90615.1 hypothetical protein EGJ54_21935 [Pandoraea apista]RRX00407.1 hypothetical protein EGJ56_19180 [Pandoraea apista]